MALHVLELKQRKLCVKLNKSIHTQALYSYTRVAQESHTFRAAEEVKQHLELPLSELVAESEAQVYSIKSQYFITCGLTWNVHG